MALTKSKAEIATIDCCLITIKIGSTEFGFETSNKLEVSPQIEEQEAKKLIIKGKLIAQKPKKATLTGHELKLFDNVFNPELAVALQGGSIVYDQVTPTKIIGYNPPLVGSSDDGEVFELNAYSAQYDASGQIVQYEKIAYPNCTGAPIAFSSEDDAFRAPEYTIQSAAKVGEKPYAITYVSVLPTLT